MNEYLENLRNTKTKSPPRLSNKLPSLTMKLLSESPGTQVRVAEVPTIYEELSDSEVDSEDEFLKHGELKRLDELRTEDLEKNDTGDENSEEVCTEDLNDKLDDLPNMKEPKMISHSRRSSSLSQSPADQTNGNSLNRDQVDFKKIHIKLEKSYHSDERTDSFQRTEKYHLEYSEMSAAKNIDILKQSPLKHGQRIENRLFENGQKKCIFYSICVLILVAWISTFSSNTIPKVTTASSAKEAIYKEKFNAFLDLMKSKYPNQTNLFWANIQSTYRHSILKSKDPSIILIVSDKSTKNLANDISYDILNSVKASIEEYSHNLNDLIISPKTDTVLSQLINKKNGDKVKLHVDTKLNRIFDSGQRIALVKNIDIIPATSMLLFYTYGDDLLSAKYPGVILLMTVELDEIIDETNELRKTLLRYQSKLTSYVENYLFEIWSKQVGEDQLRPLFTRIANNVVLVNNE